MPATTRRGPLADAIVLAVAPAGRGAFAPAWAVAAGRPICVWAVEALATSPHIARVALVVDAGHLARAKRQIAAADWRTVRPVSPTEDAPRLVACLRAGLAALADAPAQGVVLHDGARPLLTASLLNALFAAWDGTDIVAAATPVKETLKVVDDARLVRQTPPRDRLWQLHPPLLMSRSPLERIVASAIADSERVQEGGLEALLTHAPDVRPHAAPAGHEDIVVRRRADVVLVEDMLATIKDSAIGAR